MSEYTMRVKTTPYVMLSSDYSQQEPKITAYVSSDPNMIKAFQEGKDIYSTIASIAFGLPYEACLEFHPETHEYQPDGKARRSEAKSIVLGICYGRSVKTIGEQLYDSDDTLTDDERTAKAQKVYDSVLAAFPNLHRLMVASQARASKIGYTETILGRRRHLPNMTLPEFEFKALPGYVNPDIDPLDPNTLKSKNDIPERVVSALTAEFSKYKYFGQIVRRTRELRDQHIRVINNRNKINDATRQVVNCVDEDTEILTLNGWKRYNEISIGDDIYALNLQSGKLIYDTILDIHIKESNNYDIDMVQFNASAKLLSTLNHRWIVNNVDNYVDKYKIMTTEEIMNAESPVSIVTSVDVEESASIFSHDMITLIGVLLGLEYNNKTIRIKKHVDSGEPVESTRKFTMMVNILRLMKIGYEVESTKDYIYYHLSDSKNLLKADHFIQTIPSSFDALSKDDAIILIQTILLYKTSSSDCPLVDYIQYLCARFGIPYINNEVQFSVKNSNSRVKIDPSCSYTKVKSRVAWCVTTTSTTWIARRCGTVFFTGNSIVQGSAAEMTKMAMLSIYTNKEFRSLGARILLPVHDEIICECPLENADKVSNLISSLMSEAGNFLPFPINCDVTISTRWYGLEYPCPYKEPTSLDNLSEDEIKWIQYMLYDCEYVLPVYKNPDGSKPRGDAAMGVNGIISNELIDAINSYRNKYNLATDKEFIEHIKSNVKDGYVG